MNYRGSEPLAKYFVLGVPVSVVTLELASAAIHCWAEDDVGRMVFIRDVHGIMQAHDDPELLALHHQASMITPDGMPLVWIGKSRGLAVGRTSGPDLFPYLVTQSATTGLKHYFYGGKPGVAEKLKEVFEKACPDARIVKADAPPFRPLTDEELGELAADINASGAHVVWVGISTPKQERLMGRLLPLISATLIGVGAAFDFQSGAISRAPAWMQHAGLEWLYRLGSEPRRLWYRYLVMAPHFVFLAVLDELQQRSRRR